MLFVNLFPDQDRDLTRDSDSVFSEFLNSFSSRKEELFLAPHGRRFRFRSNAVRTTDRKPDAITEQEWAFALYLLQYSLPPKRRKDDSNNVYAQNLLD